MEQKLWFHVRSSVAAWGFAANLDGEIVVDAPKPYEFIIGQPLNNVLDRVSKKGFEVSQIAVTNIKNIQIERDQGVDQTSDDRSSGEVQQELPISDYMHGNPSWKNHY